MSKLPISGKFPDSFIMTRINKDGETESRRYIPAQRDGLKAVFLISYILLVVGIGAGFFSFFANAVDMVLLSMIVASAGAILLFAAIGEL